MAEITRALQTRAREVSSNERWLLAKKANSGGKFAHIVYPEGNKIELWEAMGEL